VSLYAIPTNLQIFSSNFFRISAGCAHVMCDSYTVSSPAFPSSRFRLKRHVRRQTGRHSRHTKRNRRVTPDRTNLCLIINYDALCIRSVAVARHDYVSVHVTHLFILLLFHFISIFILYSEYFFFF